MPFLRLQTPFAGSASLTDSGRKLQIAVVLKSESFAVQGSGSFSVLDWRGQTRELVAHQPYEVEATEEGLRLGSLHLPEQARLEPREPGDSFLIGRRRYRGPLILRRNRDKTVTAIEEVAVEDYLQGVLPHEMDPSWPLEALKAQAVVARTFAYTQLGKFRQHGFDLTADTRSQVYGGLGAGHDTIRRAVSETHGEVLGYQGQILSVYYHACCGGHTAHAAAVWGGATQVPPPLWGVRDRFCERSPLARWSVFFTYDEILAALQRRRLIGGPLRRFEIGRRDRMGYVRTFLARVGSEDLTVAANDFRNWIGNTQMRSTRVQRIRKRANGIEFLGQGSGHGVGLCQWGARLQAEKGQDYERLLEFYFPKATLSVIDE